MRPSCLRMLFSGCLILLQGVDFLFTWALLDGGMHLDVYEANPVANAILARQGWLGLAGYKGLCTAVALVAGLVVSARRPAVGLRLLAVECLVMSGVVGWSAVLVQRPAETQHNEMTLLEQRGHQLHDRIKCTHQFHVAREEICRLVIRGEAGLYVGLERMRTCIESNRPKLTRAQQRGLPDTRYTAQVAAYLYHHCSRLLELEPGGAARLESLGRAIGRRFPTAPRIKASMPLDFPAPRWTCQATQEG
ncbi:MAG: DUF5658 family protein [Gemmataceae bacterium]